MKHTEKAPKEIAKGLISGDDYNYFEDHRLLQVVKAICLHPEGFTIYHPLRRAGHP
jgi:hypothetical protein